MHVDTLISLITLGLFIWAIFWSHSAFQRWEEREEAKIKALQRIATAMQANGKTAPPDNPSANW